MGRQEGVEINSTGSAMSEECDRCGREYDELTGMELTVDRQICDACIWAIDYNIENHKWQDRYTEKQHERAISILEERDEIQCIISSYEDGQIIVHTPYVASHTVTDLCAHFGFRIAAFEPLWEEEGKWPCVEEHGSTFQILLDYHQRSKKPIPLEAQFEDIFIEDLDENDKQF